MKKIALVISLLVLAGCASKGTTNQNVGVDSSVKTAAGHSHHDYKGEVK